MTIHDGSLESCRRARTIVDAAPAESISPTIAGTGVTNGTTPGEFCFKILDAKYSIFPPPYHHLVAELLVAQGLGGVQISYDSTQPQLAQ